MIASADLADLVTLDRRRLHVFVAGPGCGEGIAVACGGRGWLFVDGCEVERRIPLLSILDRWRGPASFDDGGGVQGPWRGPRAFAVVP